MSPYFISDKVVLLISSNLSIICCPLKVYIFSLSMKLFSKMYIPLTITNRNCSFGKSIIFGYNLLVCSFVIPLNKKQMIYNNIIAILFLPKNIDLKASIF